MATFKIQDRAQEFRIEIVGRFAGGCVEEVRTAWQNALRGAVQRQMTVDLTGLSGYDAVGRKLLRDMHQHGTQFAAGTPDALVFLQEISTPVRRGPAMVQDVAANRKESGAKLSAQPLPTGTDS